MMCKKVFVICSNYSLIHAKYEWLFVRCEFMRKMHMMNLGLDTVYFTHVSQTCECTCIMKCTCVSSFLSVVYQTNHVLVTSMFV